ncbi:hypothetical protein GCM10010387_46120 [Streptomyces inusitatus]|uniref:Uncharacterized protein n=1 Tax=Streptomyces inusitatus TaxID=68221 RepID=A0A918QFS3_9ACTN|nr:hypothetical protein [Streptomyces inusitatus]GGZ46454.1 hypothetical protein GCM10010387_46120 [Streptomyces inusitatus]
MTVLTGYHRETLPTGGLARREPASYMLYERAGEGAAEPLGDQPLQRVHELSGEIGIAEWRAHGWAAFEPGCPPHPIVSEREAGFQRDGRTWLGAGAGAGAGIVENSLFEREFEETCEKPRGVSRFPVPGTEGEER